MKHTELIDPFIWRTRLTPLFVVMLPPCLLILNLFPDTKFSQGLFMSFITMTGILSLVGNVARDIGKGRQQKLDPAGGAPPSTMMLRLSEKFPPQETKQAYHRILRKLWPEFPEDIAKIETEDPVRADHIYSTATAKLREWTRDSSQFRMVFEENVHYTARRNLWRMKPLACWVGVISLVGIILHWLWLHKADLSDFGLSTVLESPLTVASLAVVCSLLILWWWIVDEKWVREAGQAYAKQLLNSLFILE